MNFEEFLKKDEPTPVEMPTAGVTETPTEESAPAAVEEELDVQKVVVESLAADKAAQDEMIASLRKANYALQTEVKKLQAQLAEQNAALAKVGDVLAKNSELPLSNQIALLDRPSELEDRFPGETRDHVIEVLKEAREQAEKDGLRRRAQILEGVLINNESSGNLAKKRSELEKLFSENGNILSGPVMEALNKCGISYKNGEEYLLCSEIIKRNY